MKDVVYLCDGKKLCGSLNYFCGANNPINKDQCYHTKDPEHAINGAAKNDSEINEERFELINGVFWERGQEDEG